MTLIALILASPSEPISLLSSHLPPPWETPRPQHRTNPPLCLDLLPVLPWGVHFAAVMARGAACCYHLP